MKKQQPDAITQLRKLINDGFKEYDGDIREEALEVLDDVNNAFMALDHQLAEQSEKIKDLESVLIARKDISDFYKKKSDALEKTNKELADFCDDYMRKEIDFGTAKLYYAIEPGGVCVINEIMKALKDAAQVVPLTELLTAIKRSPSFPR